ncbi:transporter substrate-binding domain-containing protein [Halocynthiibacter namhaensis]|uniref:transporter substrate-binding domain-containing protein n=1 Tax=Halocynthiibacter namhaensis TaxID=1290553 RepID=UPI00068B2033|nr:transporter substrate-binding domain-containing protein [Halocynthiibacter namhaensis]
MKYLATCCLLASLIPTSVFAQQACEPYEIRRGDSLRKLSLSVYGTKDYGIIYDANRDVIGANPNVILVGTVLQLPCDPHGHGNAVVSVDTSEQTLVITNRAQVQADAMVLEAETRAAVARAEAAEMAAHAESEILAAQEAAAAAVAAAEAEVAQARADAFAAVEAATSLATPEPLEAVKTRQIVLITGGDYPPYTDENLPDRGLYTKLVETAFLRADPEQPYKIQFVNDWNSHLDLLMPSLAFDATFPWARPDCEHMEMLADSDRNRCKSYNFSNPFYEVVDGYYSLAGSGYEDARSYDAFAGTVICRPEGYSLSNMSKAGLVEPVITLIRPVSVAACFEALRDGEVNIVALDVQVATDIIADLDMEFTAIENPNLLEVKSLNVMTHVDNPEGQAVLDTLNRGLSIMQNSGEWRDIVSTALKYQMDNL